MIVKLTIFSYFFGKAWIVGGQPSEHHLGALGMAHVIEVGSTADGQSLVNCCWQVQGAISSQLNYNFVPTSCMKMSFENASLIHSRELPESAVRS